MYVIPKNAFSPLACSVIVPMDGCQSRGTHDIWMTDRIYWYDLDGYRIQCVRLETSMFSIFSTFPDSQAHILLKFRN